MNKKLIIYTLVAVFIQGLLMNLGHPVTPKYVENLQIDDIFFGYFFSAMSTGMLFGGLLFGALGDIGSKSKYITIGVIGYAVSQALFATVGNEYIMLIFRFTAGFFAAAPVTLIIAHLLTLTKEENRTRILAYSVGVLSIGTTTGYFIGGTLGDFFIREVFYVQAITMIIYSLFVGKLIIEEHIINPIATTKKGLIEGFAGIKYLNASAIVFLLTVTLVSMGFMTISKFLDVYYTTDLNRDTSDLGLFVYITGLTGLFTNFVIVPLLTKLNKPMLLLILNQMFAGIIIIITFNMSNMYISLYSIFQLYMVMKASFQPLEMKYISTYAKGEKYGLIMGVRQSFMSLGFIVGPLIAGFAYDRNPVYPFFMSAGLFLVAALLLTMIYISRKKAVIVES